MQLFINGVQAVKGQEVKTFLGETCKLIGWREPHKPSSSGKVWVSFPCSTSVQEFYPSVIKGNFIKEEENV